MKANENIILVGIRLKGICKGRQNPLQPCWGHPTQGETASTSRLLRDFVQVTQLIPVLLMSQKKVSNMKNSFTSSSEEDTS